MISLKEKKWLIHQLLVFAASTSVLVIWLGYSAESSVIPSIGIALLVAFGFQLVVDVAVKKWLKI